jgi:hypothetical protein
MSDPLIALEALKDSISAGVQARKLQGSLGAAAERLIEVPRQAKRFEALVDAAIALGAPSDVAARRSLVEAANEADEIGELLEVAQSADQLKYATDDIPKLNQALRSLDATVRQLWRSLAASEFQSLVAIGDLLTGIEKTQDVGSRLAALGRQALALADRSGPTDEMAPEIQGLRDQREALDAELHAITDNPDVDVFLAAIARHTATLDLVTPPVVQWLTRYNALGAFAVRGSI